MSVHRINALESLIALQHLKSTIDNGFEVSDIRWGDTPVQDFELCAPNGKVTPRQKAPNHRRPEKRLRKSK